MFRTHFLSYKPRLQGCWLGRNGCLEPGLTKVRRPDHAQGYSASWAAGHATPIGARPRFRDTALALAGLRDELAQGVESLALLAGRHQHGNVLGQGELAA